MKLRTISLFWLAALLAACSAESDEQMPPAGQRGLTLTTSVNSFDGGDVTRTTLAGTDFATGDRIKLKIICPFVSHTNFGETTYSESADGLWLMEWEGASWGLLEGTDSVDMTAAYKYTGSYNLFNIYEAQQTPYVYTASTWSENVFFMAPNSVGGPQRAFSQYSYIFEADQSQEKNYLKSDLLWAQTYMQTGSYNVHLSFQHVMACLKIDASALSLSDTAVVTLENMPDIDQREVVVGDYYAARAKNITHGSYYYNSSKAQPDTVFDYSYKRKYSCAKEHNGKVLGVAVINDATARVEVWPMTGNPLAFYYPRDPDDNTQSLYVANTGVYTAYYNSDSGYYYLIVPPCDLSGAAKKPTLWIRDGVKRSAYELQTVTFEQGKLYPVNVTGVVPPPPAPDPTPDPDPEP